MRLAVVVWLVALLVGCGGTVPLATSPATPVAAEPINASALAPLLSTDGYTGDQLAAVVNGGQCTVTGDWQRIEADPDAYRGRCAIFSATGRQSAEDAAYFYMALTVGPSLDATVGTTRDVVVRWDAGAAPGFSFDPTAIHTIIGTVQGGIAVGEGAETRTMPVVLAADFDLSRIRRRPAT